MVFEGESSTENSATNAWNVNFNNGERWNNNKYNTNYVRPVLALVRQKILIMSENLSDYGRRERTSFIQKGLSAIYLLR